MNLNSTSVSLAIKVRSHAPASTSISSPSRRSSSAASKTPKAETIGLSSMTDFQNATMIHQKRLKVNNSQLRKATDDFWRKATPNRAHLINSSNLQHRCTLCLGLLKHIDHHEALLENRRDMLERQSEWLQQALTSPILKYSNELELALDVQVAAANDLATRTSLRDELRDWCG